MVVMVGMHQLILVITFGQMFGHGGLQVAHAVRVLVGQGVDELEAAVREPGLERLAVSRAGGGCSIAAVVAAEGKRTAGSRLTEGMDSSRVEGRNFRPSWSSEVFTPGWEASRAVWKKEFAI